MGTFPSEDDRHFRRQPQSQRRRVRCVVVDQVLLVVGNGREFFIAVDCQDDDPFAATLMLDELFVGFGLDPRLRGGLTERGFERCDGVAHRLVHEVVGLKEAGLASRFELLGVGLEQHVPAVRQPFEIDVGHDRNRVVEFHGRALVHDDAAAGVGELLEMLFDQIRQFIRLADDDQRLVILERAIRQRPFVNDLRRIAGSREGVVRGQHGLFVVAADVVGVDGDLLALERGVLWQRGDPQLDLLAGFFAGLLERDVFLAHREFGEAPQDRDVMAGQQRFLEHRADPLGGVVDLGEVRRLHRDCVQPPVAGESGGQHPVHRGAICVRLLRRRNRIAKELTIHRVSHARRRIVRFLQLHTGVSSQPVDAPIDEDMRRGDIVDLLIERVGAVHDGVRGVQVRAEGRLRPDHLDVSASLPLAVLHDFAADGHVLEPVVARSRRGIVGELPAALLVPRLLVPIRKAGCGTTGGRLAPTEARLIERADADDVGREPPQSLGRVKAQQPHRLVHVGRRPALHRAERFVSHIAGPIHVNDSRQVRRDGVLEHTHPDRLDSARCQARPRLLRIEPSITEGVAQQKIRAARLQLIEVRGLRHEHRRVADAAADDQLADVFAVELHGIHVGCQ